MATSAEIIGFNSQERSRRLRRLLKRVEDKTMVTPVNLSHQSGQDKKAKRGLIDVLKWNRGHNIGDMSKILIQH